MYKKEKTIFTDEQREELKKGLKTYFGYGLKSEFNKSQELKVKKELTFEEIVMRRPEKEEIWKSEENGILRINSTFIEIDEIDVWVISRDDLFELVNDESVEVEIEYEQINLASMYENGELELNFKVYDDEDIEHALEHIEKIRNRTTGAAIHVNMEVVMEKKLTLAPLRIPIELVEKEKN